jgi:hypothetical protein
MAKRVPNDNDSDDGYNVKEGSPAAILHVRSPGEGAFASMAAKAGMSKSAFAKANIHATGRVGKLARLYYTMEGVHGTGYANASEGGAKTTTPKDRLYQVG